MDKTDFDERREDLRQSIERDEEEVRLAVQELTGAARHTFKASEQIKQFPLTWTAGAFFAGMWLGSRGAPVRATERRDGAGRGRSR